MTGEERYETKQNLYVSPIYIGDVDVNYATMAAKTKCG